MGLRYRHTAAEYWHTARYRQHDYHVRRAAFTHEHRRREGSRNNESVQCMSVTYIGSAIMEGFAEEMREAEPLSEDLWATSQGNCSAYI